MGPLLSIEAASVAMGIKSVCHLAEPRTLPRTRDQLELGLALLQRWESVGESIQMNYRDGKYPIANNLCRTASPRAKTLSSNVVDQGIWECPDLFAGESDDDHSSDVANATAVHRNTFALLADDSDS